MTAISENKIRMCDKDCAEFLFSGLAFFVPYFRRFLRKNTFHQTKDTDSSSLNKRS